MSLTEFMHLNESKGLYWFNPDTLAFFKSHVSTIGKFHSYKFNKIIK